MTDLPVAISYSGGTSSEWLVRAVIKGILPRPEHLCAVFADTGAEHSWTYARVDLVERACKDAGIDFLRCAAEHTIIDDLLAVGRGEVTRVDQPPLYIAKGHGRGVTQHRCTAHYKIAPMRRAVSAWLAERGLPKRVVKWIGFAADEAARAQKAIGKQDVQWESIDFPAIRLGVDRVSQRADLVRWTGSAPDFSACVMCPKKDPPRWMRTTGADLDTAIMVDEAIRDLDCIGLTDGPAYLTDRLIPIADLVRNGDPQPTLPGLEPYCDGGACFL
jgi:hypothetical protein